MDTRSHPRSFFDDAGRLLDDAGQHDAGQHDAGQHDAGHDAEQCPGGGQPTWAVGARLTCSLLGGLALGLLLGGCGASEPLEADIYHDPLLRPSVVESEGPDARLLAGLDEVPGTGTLEVGGAPVTVEAPYPAASGRTCRSVGELLACRSESGWEFVPVVLPTAGVTPDEGAP